MYIPLEGVGRDSGEIWIVENRWTFERLRKIIKCNEAQKYN